MGNTARLALQPDLLWMGEQWLTGHSLLVGSDGRIAAIAANDSLPAGLQVERLTGRALLPGMVNAHSHSFQRLLRGRAERRVARADGGPADFWSWRDVMYACVAQLSLEEIYIVARMCFLEMALAGITTVGEFHYVHRQPGGGAYGDGNAVARTVMAAAQSVGLRMVLLRSAYFRSGFGEARDPGQVRFFEPVDEYLENTRELLSAAKDTTTIAVAPHSLRAVPLEALRAIHDFASEHALPVHMHVSEQRKELEQTRAEHGATPVELLLREGLLHSRFTAIHATHVSDAEMSALAAAGCNICVCPTTERNLGDGIFRADRAVDAGIPLCFGTDSQAQISLLEDAREMEYHLRLRDEQRLRLELDDVPMATRLYDAASSGGARALGVDAGAFVPGQWADAVAFDLDHVSFAGSREEDLLSNIVFSSAPAAVQDVFVQGRKIVADQQIAAQDEVKQEYRRIVHCPKA